MQHVQAARSCLASVTRFCGCSSCKEIAEFWRKASLRGWRIRSIWPAQPDWPTDGWHVGDELARLHDTSAVDGVWISCLDVLYYNCSLRLFILPFVYHFAHRAFRRLREPLANVRQAWINMMPCYRRQDRAMCPMYGCPENFSKVPEYAHGYFSRHF